jgi:hypothetical protein
MRKFWRLLNDDDRSPNSDGYYHHQWQYPRLSLKFHEHPEKFHICSCWQYDQGWLSGMAT